MISFNLFASGSITAATIPNMTATAAFSQTFKGVLENGLTTRSVPTCISYLVNADGRSDLRHWDDASKGLVVIKNWLSGADWPAGASPFSHAGTRARADGPGRKEFSVFEPQCNAGDGPPEIERTSFS